MEDWLTRMVLTGSYTYERERKREGRREWVGKRGKGKT